MDRTAYRLYGEQVGTGADGESLLRVTKADRQLGSIDQKGENLWTLEGRYMVN